MPTFRPLSLPDDYDALTRLWNEIGWLPDDAGRDEVEAFMGGSVGWVGELDGDLESFAARRVGQMVYDGIELPLALVMGVAVSRRAQRRGLGSGCAGRLLSDAARSGAAVAYLGVFDTGYYDRLGFGSTSRAREITIDPIDLRVPKLTRFPIRLDPVADIERMHASRQRRMKRHGSATYDDVAASLGEVKLGEDVYAFGFEDDDGRLTHHICIEREGENGPDEVLWMAYETPEQAIELFSLVRSWGVALHGLRLIDPPGIDLQSLLNRPLRRQNTTAGGDFDPRPESVSWMQLRILDVEAAIAAVRIPGDPLRFQLDLSDPLEGFLDREAPWRGLTGSWVVTLGENSHAEPGTEEGLPVLSANVGAFTRLWLGAERALTLKTCDELDAPTELIERLERRWRLPTPFSDWDA